jgi:hypothetical protein
VIITSQRFPEGIANNCASCAALGYTTTLQAEQGDVQLTQAVVGGSVTGIVWSSVTGLFCPACGQPLGGSLTVAALKALTAKTNPSLLHPIVVATLAGTVYSGSVIP